LMPFAPGALHDTTSYVPAHEVAADEPTVATTTSVPTNARIPALITLNVA
jgi:hypothetical protein